MKLFRIGVLVFFMSFLSGIKAQVNLDSLFGVWNDESKADTSRLKAMQKIQSSNIKLMIIGGGPLLQEIKDIVENRNLKNKIKVLGKIHSQELYKFTNSADCGINLLDEINLSKKFTTATKMFDYFQAGIPIICSDIVENKNLFNQFQAGILTRNKVMDLRDNIIKMSESSNVEKYKINSLKASKVYYWERQESTLFALFDD